MNKYIALILFVFILLLLTPHKVFASVIFEDHFDNGDSSKWTPVLGPNLWVVDSQKGYGGLISSGGILVDSVSNVDITTPNYSIEYDYFPVQGADKNFDFHWTGNSPLEEIHLDGGNAIFKNQIVPYVMSNNAVHHIKIAIQNTKFQFYIDGTKVYDTEDAGYVFSGHDQFGVRMSAGSVFPTETYFDNVKVTTDDPDTLAVPSLKQTNSLWATNLYDSANQWTPGLTNIGTWGCALTSAAMVLQYNQITKLPNDQDLTPGTLNDWLKSVPDGYVRNGLVNWLAISRMTKLAKINNLGFTHDALEYNRVGYQDDTMLSNLLTNNIPPILEEPGHFIVATGTDSANATFFINDPFYSRTTLADSYNKNYLSMGTYTPVNSDLSYAMFVVDPNVTISVTNSTGNSVGESFIQNPIASDPLGIINTNGAVKIFYLPKPSSGNYTLHLSSSNSTAYSLDQYLYDVNGNVSKSTDTGNLTNGPKDTYRIVFNKNNISNSKSSKVTFDYIKQEINQDHQQKKIKSFVTFRALLLELDIAKNSKNKVVARATLNAMVSTINHDKKINSTAASILISDIQSLRNSI